MSLTGLACFLYKNTNMFTFSVYFSLKTKSSVALRPLRAPSCSCWRAEWKHNGRAAPALHTRRFCAASALLTRAVWNQALLKRSHVISEIFLLLQCAAAGSARALEQRRPCTSTSATMSNFYSHTLKKWSQMQPFWSQSRALCKDPCCLWEGQRDLRFYQKYLNLCSEDERKSYGFGTTWGWVINDRIFILGWTMHLSLNGFDLTAHLKVRMKSKLTLFTLLAHIASLDVNN